MTRLHTGIDVYVDNDLRHTSAQLIEQAGQVKVRTRQGRWIEQFVLTEAEFIPNPDRRIWAWTGLLDGEAVTLTGVKRVTGCTKCSGRR